MEYVFTRELVHNRYKIFKEKHLVIEDAFSKEFMGFWKLLDENARRETVANLVKDKTKQDPEFEIFTFILKHPHHLISNKGRIFSLNHNKFMGNYKDKDGYVIYSLRIPGRPANTYRLHRLLGIHFLSKPGHLNALSLDELQINHKDGIKDNNELSNIEWCTGSENIIHAILNGLQTPEEGLKDSQSKLVLGEIIENIEGYKGYKFTLCGSKNMRENGFNSSHIFECLKEDSKYNLHKGCKFIEIEKSCFGEYPHGLPKDFDKSLLITKTSGERCANFKGNIIATNLKTGETKILTGSQDIIDNGFNPSGVYTFLSGKSSHHRFHTFHREGDPIPEFKSKEIIYSSGINNPKIKLIKGTIINGPEEYIGYSFTLCGKNHIKENGFRPNQVMACCEPGSEFKIHKGCKFEFIDRGLYNEGIHGLPSDLNREQLITVRDYTNVKSYKGDVIATHMFTKEQIVLKGEKDMETFGFHSGSISKCLLGKAAHHKYYTFERIAKSE